MITKSNRAALRIAGILLLGAVMAPPGAQAGGNDHRGGDHRGEGYRGEGYRGGGHPPPMAYRHPGYYPPPIVYGQPQYYPPPVVYGPAVGIVLPGLSIGIM